MPMHFRELVLLYSLTCSRLAPSLLDSGSPFGSYQTVKTWLRSGANASSPVSSSVSGSGVMVMFDNNQVMQRRWQISLNNTVKSSTITMVVFLEMPQVTLIYSPQFTPAQWMWSQFPADGLEQLFSCEALGRCYLYQHDLHPWLTEILVEVTQEQLVLQNGQFEDPVDKRVREKKHSKDIKTCLNFGDINMPRRNRLCRNCNTTIDCKKTNPKRNHIKLRKLGFISTAILTPRIRSATRNRPHMCSHHTKTSETTTQRNPQRSTLVNRSSWTPAHLMLWLPSFAPGRLTFGAAEAHVSELLSCAMACLIP